MIKEFVEAWDKNKSKLKNYFATTKQEEYDDYGKIVKALFDVVINPYFAENPYIHTFDVDSMRTIDDGDYQGTQIFILHRDGYQPSCEDYVYTNTYYGSCSGCDTLESIRNYEDDVPSTSQLKDYMTLALHLLQKCNYMEAGDENETDYEEKEILTEKEKEYLSAFFAPFRDDVEYVVKHRNVNNLEYLSFMDSRSLHTFPDFNSGEHYKNMELGVHYTLDELKI